MPNKILLYLILGLAVRAYLVNTNYGILFGNRAEVSTPLNSNKRLLEGIHLYSNGIDPYIGDMVHEMPLILYLMLQITTYLPGCVSLIFIALDLLTAWILYISSQRFIREKLMEQEEEKDTYAPDTKELQLHSSDLITIPRYVLLAYLFNPMSVLSCIGCTTTVFSNLLLALVFYCIVRRSLVIALTLLAIETMRNIYPIILLAPFIVVFARRSSSPTAATVNIVTLFITLCSAIAVVNYLLMGSWHFLDGTLGFIFFYRDLQPNIGLFWYFFTEMFEHFRTLFLFTFQINATILYAVPLTLKLRKEPLLLFTILIAIMAIFRAYPCLGDISFYLALMPLWKRCWKFMAHNFVVFCFFLVTLSVMPALWHLWIYAGSANANFYFGVTLAFSTGQIFLITDLLFAHVKREFCLKNGQKVFIDGKEAKIILE